MRAGLAGGGAQNQERAGLAGGSAPDRDSDAMGRDQRDMVSVNDHPTAKPWVMLVKHGRAVRQPVQMSRQNSRLVKITKDVIEGDLVISLAAGVLAGA